MERNLYRLLTIAQIMALTVGCQSRQPGVVVPTYGPDRGPIPTPTLAPTAESKVVVWPTETVNQSEKINLRTYVSFWLAESQGSLEIRVLPLILSKDSQIKFDSFQDNIALTNPKDQYGNIVLEIHSGWAKQSGEWQPLPAEGLRALVQGGSGPSILAENDLATQDQVIKNLIGTQVEVYQDSHARFVVTGAQRVARGDIADFRADSYQVVSKLVAYAKRDGYESTFVNAENGSGVVMIISLRSRKGDGSPEPWSHEALVLYLQPFK